VDTQWLNAACCFAVPAEAKTRFQSGSRLFIFTIVQLDPSLPPWYVICERQRERENERVHVCVCEREKEREGIGGGRGGKGTPIITTQTNIHNIIRSAVCPSPRFWILMVEKEL
jgi:hypothetical protein